ncbi:DUF47 domain-containing protein [Kaistella antarctica]|uniref:Phosphate transport regulator n=1 Tax=Kaistella antarctica TaxID=266748 RepID=A0A448NMN4_9FLAO|nr:DUF47 family protein [Kaistella antarctica]KEY20040.1 phosphate transport regulator [Kaistella antarctica]SEV94446.1 hypothetical protein SAMN05421765_1347 [Kaistella antarctica]VEH95599.1 Phosphate transport regulator (distant homolog of PhoU) [Kaistella antarctica]
MGIGNIFKIFQPKDKVFFVLFEKVAEELVAMSKEFHESLLDFDINDDTMLQHMSDYEHRMDDLTHEIFVQLGENFITPFDREDISHLASGLDDIADFMYASAKYIYLYKAPLDPAYTEFTLLIYKSCIEVQLALKNLNGFKDPKAVKESCIKINSFENIADDVLSQAIVKLFETNDALLIIKVKSVLEYLETVTDKAEDVANTIDSILIKYA